MIAGSFYKVLTIVYKQEGLDANNINTVETISNYKCFHIYTGLWRHRLEKQWVVSELDGWVGF